MKDFNFDERYLFSINIETHVMIAFINNRLTDLFIVYSYLHFPLKTLLLNYVLAVANH